MGTIYCDGVVNVSVIEGNARLELVRMRQPDKDGQAKYDVENILVLSPPAFLRFHQQVDAMVAKLVEERVLQATAVPQTSPGDGIVQTGVDVSKTEHSRSGGGTEKAESKPSGWKKFFGGKSAN